jgi:hypothetical protein
MTMTTRDADGAVLREVDCVTLLCDVATNAKWNFDQEFQGTLTSGAVGTILMIAASGEMELEFVVDDRPAFANAVPRQVRLYQRATEKSEHA